MIMELVDGMWTAGTFKFSGGKPAPVLPATNANVTLTGIEHGPPRWEVALSYGTAIKGYGTASPSDLHGSSLPEREKYTSTSTHMVI
jgi:hypothetical protein